MCDGLHARGPRYQGTVDCTAAIVDLYTKWNSVDAGNGYDLKASDWKLKLDGLLATAPHLRPSE